MIINISLTRVFDSNNIIFIVIIAFSEIIDQSQIGVIFEMLYNEYILMIIFVVGVTCDGIIQTNLKCSKIHSVFDMSYCLIVKLILGITCDQITK